MDRSSPRMPADAGLMGLGLLMQLGGGFFALFYTFGVLRAIGDSVLVFGLMALGALRSTVHLVAGYHLAQGRATGRPLALVYAAAGLVQAIAVALWFAGQAGQPRLAALWVGLTLVAWPIIVTILVLRPRASAALRRATARDEDLLSADAGISGLGILMLGLGIIGMAAALVFGRWVLAGGDRHRVILATATALLAGRSYLHAMAGLRLLRAPEPAVLRTWSRRYLLAGVASTAAVGVALIATAGDLSTSLGAAATVIGWVAATLLLWPIVVFLFARRPERGGGFGAALRTRIPPDGGLTTAGQALLAFGGLGLVAWLPHLIPIGLGEVALPLVGGIAGLVEGPWFELIRVLLMLAAGVALVTMHPSYRLVATAYGAVALVMAGVELYRTMGAIELIGPTQVLSVPALRVTSLVASVVIPAVLLLLAQRRLPDQRTVDYSAFD